MSESTPRPWYPCPSNGWAIIRAGTVEDDILICEMTSPKVEADARLIVRAVNCHDAIVEALELAYKELNAIRARDGAPQHIDWDRGRPFQTSGCTEEWFGEVVDKARAALAQVEEES